MPTPRSLRYISAVWTGRYPIPKARSAPSAVYSGGIWNTPNPGWGR